MVKLEHDLTPDDITNKILQNPIRVVSCAEVNEAILSRLAEGRFTVRESALARLDELDRLHPELVFAIGPVMKPTGRILYHSRRVMLNFESGILEIWGGPYKRNIRDGIFRELMEAR